MAPEQSETSSHPEVAPAAPSEALEAYEKARLFFNRFFDTAPELRKQTRTAEYHQLLDEVTILIRFFPNLYEEIAQERKNRPPEPRRKRRLPGTRSSE